MYKILPLLLLIGCGHHRLFKKDYITLSESPCVDGTILNIDQAGCEMFYWGTDPSQLLLKIRCTYAPEDNWWTGMTFYAIPHAMALPEEERPPLFCTDIYVHMYALPPGEEMKIQ